MAKVLVLYYSAFGHIARMAEEIAAGAASVPGVEVEIMRVPELSLPDGSKPMIAPDAPDVPTASIDDLPNYDGIIFGTRTHLGHISGQMRNFLDQAGDLWKRGALVGKVGSVFTSAANYHGGHEITSFHTILFHLGFIVVGMPYLEEFLMETGQIGLGSPFGATTLAGGEGHREPSAGDLALARFQGAHVARIAAKLAG
jgi:NAD(P)H dehydrogenase (quinone)